MDFAKNIIIDMIFPDYIQGWMHKSYIDKELIINFNLIRKKMNYQFLDREDLPDGYIGFRSYIPPNIKLSPGNLLNNIIFFTISNLKIIIWEFAFMEFCQMQINKNDIKLENSSNNKYNNVQQAINNICNDVIIGTNGFLFIGEGSNKLYSQYGMNHSEAKEKSLLLKKLLDKRNLFCENNNILFLQIIIPEKSSALHALTGCDLPDMTPIYKFTCDELNKKEYFIDLYNKLAVQKCWRKGDSHIAFSGVQSIMEAIIARLGLDIKYDYINSKNSYYGGDLLINLMESNSYYEKVDILTDIIYSEKILKPKLIYMSDPPGNLHRGTIRHYVNKDAPIKKKIICFGNSYFGKGDNPLEISWHCSRLFEEFIFLWDHRMRLKEIIDIRPDIVICQSAERFILSLSMSHENYDF